MGKVVVGWQLVFSTQSMAPLGTRIETTSIEVQSIHDCPTLEQLQASPAISSIVLNISSSTCILCCCQPIQLLCNLCSHVVGSKAELRSRKRLKHGFSHTSKQVCFRSIHIAELPKETICKVVIAVIKNQETHHRSTEM